MIRQDGDVLVPVNVAPPQPGQLSGATERPVHRLQQATEGATASAATPGATRTEQEPELLVGDVAIPRFHLGFAYAAEPVGWDKATVDPPVEATLNRPQHDRSRGIAEAGLQLAGESLDVQRLDSVGFALAEKVDELLATVLVAVVSLRFPVLVGIDRRTPRTDRPRSLPPNRGEQRLLVHRDGAASSRAFFLVDFPLASVFRCPPRSVHQAHFCLFHQTFG